MNKGIALYLLTFILFGFFSYLFVDQSIKYFDFAFTNFYQSQRQFASIIYFLLILTLFLTYVYLLRSKLEYREFKILIALLIFIGVLSYPAILSFDIFNYLTTSKVAFYYLENPYIVMPIEFINEPFLEFTRATNKTALYGPVWILLSGIPFIIGMGKFIAVILGLKVLVSIFYIGILYLIHKLSNKIENVAYFALNPLVLIETTVSGHNDVVMIFLALSAIYLLKKNKLIFAFILLFVSIMIKFATIFLLPVFLYAIYMKIRNKKIDFQKVYLYSLICMLTIFILSPIREEMYPWYAIWLLPFVSLMQNKIIKILGIFITFGLMLRYIPYMYSGDYFGITPHLREFIFILPVALFLVLLIFNKKDLEKII